MRNVNTSTSTIGLAARCTCKVFDDRHAIEGLLGRIHQAVVVRQNALGADEEIVAAGDLEVEDILNLVAPHRLNGKRSIHGS